MYPVLFSTPWFNLYSYGLLITVGYTIGVAVAIREAKKNRLDHEVLFDMLILQLIIGICGSRLFFILEYAPQKLNIHDFFAFEQGGLTFYGAIVIGFVFDILFLKWHQMPFWRTMDCVGFGLPIGISIARLGCFLNGCCYGTESTVIWAVKTITDSSRSCHPTQIYESLMVISIFIIMILLRHYRRNYGEAFLFSIATYSAGRFFIEFFRAENPIVFANMTLAQILGIILTISSILMFKRLRNSPNMRIIPDQTLHKSIFKNLDK